MADVKSLAAYHQLQTIGLSPQGATEIILGKPFSNANDRARMMRLAQTARTGARVVQTGAHVLLGIVVTADVLANSWPFCVLVPTGAGIFNTEPLKQLRQIIYNSGSVQSDPRIRGMMEQAGWDGKQDSTAMDHLLIDFRAIDPDQLQIA